MRGVVRREESPREGHGFVGGYFLSSLKDMPISCRERGGREGGKETLM